MRPIRILVVDDSVVARRVISDILSEEADFEVVGTAPDGKIYMLFVQGVAIVNPETFAITMLSRSPIPIAAGGDILDGRIYFSSGSHVYSYAVPD